MLKSPAFLPWCVHQSTELGPPLFGSTAQLECLVDLSSWLSSLRLTVSRRSRGEMNLLFQHSRRCQCTVNHLVYKFIIYTFDRIQRDSIQKDRNPSRILGGGSPRKPEFSNSKSFDGRFWYKLVCSHGGKQMNKRDWRVIFCMYNCALYYRRVHGKQNCYEQD